MSLRELVTFYSERKSRFSREREEILEKINSISNLRLIIAAVFLLAIYFGFQTHYNWLYATPFIVIVFIILVRIHSRLFDKKVHLQNLADINDQEVQLLEEKTETLDAGSEFIDPHHPYSHDLDIFGDGSLFQAVNRSYTLTGRKNVASRLSSALRSSVEIEQHQEAIRELSGKTDFRQHFQAAGKEINEQKHDREQLLAWTRKESFVYGRPLYRLILWIIPMLTLAMVTGWFFSATFRPWAILLAISQWAFLGFHLKRINDFHEYIGKKKNILAKYAKLLHLIETETFASPLLKRLKDSANTAGKNVTKLAGLVRALDARMNSMTSLFVNSLLLYDLQCVYRLEKWKELHANQLESWLDAVSNMEVLSSFGTFAFNHDRFVYPQIQTQFAIDAIGMGHPLIEPGECVVNDVAIGNGPGVLIVTGANMAGKSTFLRTLGINLILALNGAPVFAQSFRCPIIHLRTGMRTADSLKDHQSYFYAELDRLKGIMDELRKDVPLLILLDEILKGTNSNDKQAGSIALVKQLLPHPCLAVIATHDLALGELEKEFPQQVRNFCFEATIENDQLSFDYTLKPGIAQKMNATFLMKKMGII